METASSAGRRAVLSSLALSFKNKDLGLVFVTVSLLKTLMLSLGEFYKVLISKHFSSDFFPN